MKKDAQECKSLDQAHHNFRASHAVKSRDGARVTHWQNPSITCESPLPSAPYVARRPCVLRPLASCTFRESCPLAGAGAVGCVFCGPETF